MASTEFVAVSWQPTELIDEDSLDQISNNLHFLRNQMVDGKYMHLTSGVTDTGLKLLCGRSLITPRASDTATIQISFAAMFTPDTNPVVTTSITSANRVQIYSIINGIGRFHPNHQGFECKVNIGLASTNTNDSITDTLCVNWIAMGI